MGETVCDVFCKKGEQEIRDNNNSIIEVEIIEESQEKKEELTIKEASFLIRYIAYYHKCHRVEFIRRTTTFPVTNIFIIQEMEHLADKIDTLILVQMLLFNEGKVNMSKREIEMTEKHLLWKMRKFCNIFEEVKKFLRKDENVSRMIFRKFLPAPPTSLL